MTTTNTTSSATNSNGSNAAVIASLNSQAQKSASSFAASNNALSGSGGSSSASGLASNLNMFLTMLTTQLQHQDPLSPTDSTQFTNQLVMYSEVEQGIQTNSNLTKLISLQNTNQQSASIGYIGQTVEVSGSDVPLQNGNAEFNYSLKSAATNAVVQIQDSSGNTVAQLTGLTTTGTHYMSWNGQNSSGTQLPDGKYTIVVKANDATGNTISATTNVYGKVTGVSSDATNGTQLDLGSAVTSTMANVTAIVDTTTLNNQIATKQ